MERELGKRERDGGRDEGGRLWQQGRGTHRHSIERELRKRERWGREDGGRLWQQGRGRSRQHMERELRTKQNIK